MVLVKTAVVPHYWSSASRLSDSQLQLRAAGTALLSSLLERNCYREFAPTDDWLAPDRFVSQVTPRFFLGNLGESAASRRAVSLV